MIPSPDLSVEISLWQTGLHSLAGLDEAGRGAWAGPVSAGAVILPDDPAVLDVLHGVRDSKRMTVRQRQIWALAIKQAAVAWNVGFASWEEIDQMGIVPATRLAMRRAMEGLYLSPQHLLIDALRLPEVELPQTPIIKGDGKSLSIAAASVLAKTERDALMIEMGDGYPGYGFERHKGYGTRFHRSALEELGPCRIHRKSFRPIRERIERESTKK